MSKNTKVTWNTPQAKTEGTIVDKRTDKFDLDAHTYRAGGEDPRYIVELDSSGARAAHQGESLTEAWALPPGPQRPWSP